MKTKHRHDLICKDCGHARIVARTCPRCSISEKPKNSIPSSKEPSFKSLYKILDRWFSIYIRLKYSFEGACKCVTCGTIRFYTNKIHCGHYIGRQYWPSRWSETNCRPQCEDCNSYNEGKKDIFEKHLIKEYGADVVTMLDVNKYGRRQSNYEIKVLIEHYKYQVKELKIKHKIKEKK
jgi:hypothetical protein